MHTRLLTLFLLSLFCFSGLFAQDSLYSKLQEPEFAFEPVMVNSDLSTTPLIKENALVSMWGKASKLTNELIINGLHSSLAVKGGSLKVVVKNGALYGTLSNPRDVNKLYLLKTDEKKKKRTGIIQEMARGFTGKIEGTTSFDLPLTFIKIKESVYIVTLENLEPGEYAWGSGSGYFTFRVE